MQFPGKIKHVLIWHPLPGAFQHTDIVTENYYFTSQFTDEECRRQAKFFFGQKYYYAVPSRMTSIVNVLTVYDKNRFSHGLATDCPKVLSGEWTRCLGHGYDTPDPVFTEVL